MKQIRKPKKFAGPEDYDTYRGNLTEYRKSVRRSRRAQKPAVEVDRNRLVYCEGCEFYLKTGEVARHLWMAHEWDNADHFGDRIVVSETAVA